SVPPKNQRITSLRCQTYARLAHTAGRSKNSYAAIHIGIDRRILRTRHTAGTCQSQIYKIINFSAAADNCESKPPKCALRPRNDRNRVAYKLIKRVGLNGSIHERRTL